MSQLDLTNPKHWIFVLSLGTLVAISMFFVGIHNISIMKNGTAFDAYVTEKREKHPGNTISNQYYVTFLDPVSEREKSYQVELDYYRNIQIGDRITVVYGDYSHPDSSDFIVLGAESYTWMFLPIGGAGLGWLVFILFFFGSRKDA